MNNTSKIVLITSITTLTASLIGAYLYKSGKLSKKEIAEFKRQSDSRYKQLRNKTKDISEYIKVG